MGVTKLVWEPYKLARAIQQSSYTKCLARNAVAARLEVLGLVQVRDARMAMLGNLLSDFWCNLGLLAAAEATRRRREILDSRAMGYGLLAAAGTTRRRQEILDSRAMRYWQLPVAHSP